VADTNGSLTGLLVDEVDQVIRIPTQEIEQPPQSAFDSYHYVKGIAKVNEKLVILLDIERLLIGPKQAEQQKPKIPTVQNTTKEPTEDLNNPTIHSLDDIPPELAEVFKEDEQGIPPAQIIRE
jgi:purine-binding chemotaxis protein CheW